MNGTSQNVLMTTLAVSNVVLVIHTIYPRLLRRCLHWLWPRTLPASPPRVSSDGEKSPRGSGLGRLLGHDYTPPLPMPVAEALERSCLCFLATTSSSLEPHLSLMRYTYTRSLDPDQDPNSEVMIISTQRKTKKFDILTQNENVALLVHDFQTHQDGDADSNYDKLGTRTKYSITLNGTTVVETGDMAEQYRSIHLERNRAYAQFIVGPDIAIVTVHLTRARVCDVNDQVTHYARDNSGTRWTEIKSPA